jgi:hypothetical protein
VNGELRLNPPATGVDYFRDVHMPDSQTISVQISRGSFLRHVYRR